MKKFFGLFLTAIVAAVVVSSCSKECDPGYEGSGCKDEVRTKFLGTYSATDNPGSLTYSVTIGTASAISSVVISSGFSDDYFVNSINATVDGTTITIPRQEPDSDDYFVEGTGTISGKVITWSYKIIDGTVDPETSITYTGTWTKP